MSLKKKKDVIPEKEDNTFSKRKKSKTINKQLFLGNLDSFFVSLFKRKKDSAVAEFYNAAV